MSSTPLMACAEVRYRELRSLKAGAPLTHKFCACLTGASYSQLPGDVCGGGHSPDGFPAVGEADDEMDVEPGLSPQPGRALPRSQGSPGATAAKSQPKPPSPVQPPRGSDQPSEPAVKMEGEVDQEEEDVARLDESTWDRLRKRRLQPGAATSDQDFAAFFSRLSLANSHFQDIAPEPWDTSDTILERVRVLTAHAKREVPQAPDYVTRLCVGVLAFARVRQADIFLREHAMVYWIVEGGRSLRFHAGDCYMRTPSGAFQQHRGVPPDHSRVQTFLLHLEGVFRLLPAPCVRRETELLQAVAQMWQDTDRDEAAFLDRCLNAALSAAEPSRRGGFRERDGEDGGDGADSSIPWPLVTAKAILVVKRQLTREITEDKLLHYMSEWCDTTKNPEPSCCYEDAAILYDEGVSPALQVDCDTLANCYLRIPHCIKGTIPQDVTARLLKFYRQTFWGNLAVFKCGQAAQALAKRGINVVRLFIGLSNGGVGQSLYSAHLRAMYGHNFAYFDPNIWYHDEEMRKQVEQLNGCCILTGQETPATSRKLREDLYKKFASGDGIAGRKPYGFRTRMIHCVGWKRLEANRMFKSAEVGARDFNSVMRRSLVWQGKARFEDAQALAGAYADIEKDGIFPKDPSLPAFVISGPAIAAGLQLQHAFETGHSKQDCLDMIENYAVWGGDNGLTETVMREACGLPPRDLREAATRAAGIINVEDDADTPANQVWQKFFIALVQSQLTQRVLYVTPARVRSFKTKEVPNTTKDGIIEGLQNMGLLLKCAGHTRSAEKSFIPVLRCKTSLDAILKLRDRSAETQFPEEYDLNAFAKYMHTYPYRKENALVLAKVLREAATGGKRAPGRLARDQARQKETLAERCHKLEKAEQAGDQLLDALSSQLGPAQPKRRRYTEKATEADVKAEELPDRLARTCRYRYTGPETVRGRRQAEGVAAQSLSRRQQLHLLQHTWDLAITNSVFVVLSQLITLLAPEPAMPKDVQDTLLACAERRRDVCVDTLQMPESKGKQLPTAVLYGGSYPANCSGQAFLQNLSRASMYCRWLACSLLPQEYAFFSTDECGKKNPEASVLAHLYTACEDATLSAWTHAVMERLRPTHLSLHFDGIRVSRAVDASADDVCALGAAAIAAQTPFKVHIREKKHETVLGLFRAAAHKREEAAFGAEDPLVQTGNCILHAMACLELAAPAAIRAKVSETEAEWNVYMRQRGCRTYAQCTAALGCSLQPTFITNTVPGGKWLLQEWSGPALRGRG